MLAALTQETGHLLPRLGHVHLQDEVGVSAEAQQSALPGSELHQLLQDGRVLLRTHTEPLTPNSAGNQTQLAKRLRCQRLKHLPTRSG